MRDAGTHLNGLITEIARYPVSFKHDTKLAKNVAAAVYIPEVDKSVGGVLLKPMAVSQTVWWFTGTPFSV